MINKNWLRWIHVSIHKHFSDAMQVESIPLFIEGQHRDTRDPQVFVELRINGPVFTEVSRNLYKVTVDVNLLLQYKMDDFDAHGMLRSEGNVLQYVTDFAIYRFGDGVDDDGSLLGCLTLMPFPDGIHVFQIGQIDKDLKLLQASIDASYHTCLSN